MTKLNEKVMRNIGDLKVGLFGGLDMNKTRKNIKDSLSELGAKEKNVMNETRKNTITSTKQAIKEMILQDSEIIKILNDKSDKEYKDANDLLGKVIFNHLNYDITTETSIRISYEVKYLPNHDNLEEMMTVATIAIMQTGTNFIDENYNMYTDILSEKILDDVIKKFSPIMHSNMPIENHSIAGGRIIEFAIK